MTKEELFMDFISSDCAIKENGLDLSDASIERYVNFMCYGTETRKNVVKYFKTRLANYEKKNVVL